ncbi:hypothetical protein GCM10007368_24970 [Isoptericola cucumis]|uniref:Beta-lactamase-related domain-containing protein n=2 Tax=Isoptericola cucumis TaxID=1776856 RepID=A0ABQ2B6Z1_9MICO|nr:hypothetical protein GCM10007368_24970 [Isoptericola cucumis]
MRRRMRAPLTLATTVALALPLGAAAAGTAQADPEPPTPPAATDAPRSIARAVADAARTVAEQASPRALSSTGQGARGDALDAALAATADGVPVGVTGTVETPELRWHGADGRRELDRRAPARPYDRFRVASITKPMVATLVLQEVERGTWTLDTPVVDVLPRIADVVPDEYEDRVTLEQLLSHRSGLPDHVVPMIASRMADPNDFDEFFDVLGEEYTTDDHVAAMGASEWAFEPGTDFSYSNAGYVVLGMALEEATGRDLDTLLEHRVFLPAGMWRTDLPDDPGEHGPFLQGAAHTGDLGSGWYSLTGFDPSLFDAAGAVTSTTGDLQKFTEALLTGDLLDPETVADMGTPRTTGDPVFPEYGLGLYRIPDPCEPGEYLYGHDGAAFGTLSMTLASPDAERQLTVGLTGRDYAGAEGPDINTALVPMLEATC